MATPQTSLNLLLFWYKYPLFKVLSYFLDGGLLPILSAKRRPGAALHLPKPWRPDGGSASGGPAGRFLRIWVCANPLMGTSEMARGICQAPTPVLSQNDSIEEFHFLMIK